jgi:hypothetical protein
VTQDSASGCSLGDARDHFALRAALAQEPMDADRFDAGAGSLCANQNGFSLHAEVRVKAHERTNEDGVEDLVVITESSSSNYRLHVLIGTGSGSFEAPVEYDVGCDLVYDPFLTDVDGDGHIDVVACSCDAVVLVRGVGDGTLGASEFMTSPNWPLGTGHLTVSAADLDGDGSTEILGMVTDPSLAQGMVSIFGLDPVLGWTLGDELNLTGSGRWGALLPVDFDSDGFPDLVAGFQDHMNVFAHNATDCDSNGVFDPSEIEAEPNLDVNENGVLDICECRTQNFCITSPNTAGPGARITAIGDPSLSTNTFFLQVTQAPPGQPGLFFFGDHAQDPPLPFGNGWKCVGGNTQRLNPPLFVDGDGTGSRRIDFALVPTNLFAAGDTAYFQFWYRDNPQVGTTFNLSDGLAVTFCE